MTRVLILGGGPLQVPVIEQSLSRGFETWIVDGSPTCPGAKLADEFRLISTIDTQKVLELVQAENIDGITTAATDKPMRVIGACADQLGKPGPSLKSCLDSTDKGRMARVFESAGVPQPEFEVGVDEPFEKMRARLQSGLPIVVKPTDSSGSRGVTLVKDASGFQEAIDYAAASSTTGEVIVQEALTGHEVSVEMLVDACGEPHVITVTDKETTGAPHFVELGHSQPTELPAKQADAVIALAKQAARALGLRSCGGHVEIMVTEQGPKIIEFGARLGGDFISTKLVPLSTGVNMVDQLLDLCLGAKEVRPEPILHCSSAVRFTRLHSGKIKQITGIDEAKLVEGVADAGTFAHEGEQASETTDSSTRAAYVIAQGTSPQQARQRAADAAKRIKVIYE